MSSTALKLIALLCMVADHIGGFIPGTPVYVHWIGRIAAPIFIFCVIWGYEYTRSRRTYVIRFYILSIAMSAANLILSYICEEILYPHQVWKSSYSTVENNIFSDFFAICTILWLIDFCIVKSPRKLYLIFLYLCYQIAGACIMVFYVPEEYMQLIGSILGNVFFVEGGFWPVGLGILFYLTRKHKKVMVGAFGAFSALFLCNAVFCISSRLVLKVPELTVNSNFTLQDLAIVFFEIFIGVPAMSVRPRDIEYIFFGDYQWMMLFALPFFILYNGKRGKKIKKFFYFFYPIHIYALWLIGNVIYNL